MLRSRHMDSWNEPASGRKLTYDDFVHFPDDGLRHELIDGAHCVTPSPAIRHQRISRDLLVSLHTYLKESGLGEVLDAPVDVVLSNHDIVAPDLLVILRDQQDVLTPQHVRGAPAIVVEILSPGTRKRDETLKRTLYERVGVREYWTIDPDNDVVLVQHFGSSHGQTMTLRRGAGQALTSPLLPGWTIAVDLLLAR
jgi:Uma2 family endonuclease